MIHSMVFAIVILGAMVGTTQAQLIEKKALTLEGAKRIVAAAEAKAKVEGARVVIAVVDEGGNLLLLQRLDDTQVASVDVGLDKARTAAIFRRPSKVFEEQVRNGRVAALALHGAVPLQGGVPIVVEGKVIGAIGVSGETPGQDEDIALAGAAVAASFTK
ncbi:MAG TPA: heme-binding protein [Nitrospira sp.]|nr:heme-binding protein [Nitrospira sp.]